MATNPIQIPIFGRDRSARAFNSVERRLQGLTKRIGGVRGILRSLGPAIGIGLGAGGIGGIFAGLRGVIDDLDEIGKAAAAAGIPESTLQQWRIFGQLSGATATQVDTSLRRVRRRLGEALGGGEVAQSFARLGVDVRNIDGSARDLDQVMNDLVTSLSTAEDPTRAFADAVRIGDIEFARFAQGIIENGGNFEILKGQLESLGAVISSETIQRAEQTKDAFTLLGTAAKAAVTEGLSPLIDALGNYAEATLVALNAADAGQRIRVTIQEFEDLSEALDNVGDSTGFRRTFEQISEGLDLNAAIAEIQRFNQEGQLGAEQTIDAYRSLLGELDNLARQGAETDLAGRTLLSAEQLNNLDAQRQLIVGLIADLQSQAKAVGEVSLATDGLITREEALNRARTEVNRLQQNREIALATISVYEELIAAEEALEDPNTALIAFFEKQLEQKRNLVGLSQEQKEAEEELRDDAETLAGIYRNQAVARLQAQGLDDQADRLQFILGLDQELTAEGRARAIAEYDQTQAIIAQAEAKAELVAREEELAQAEARRLEVISEQQAFIQQDIELTRIDLELQQGRITPLMAFLEQQRISLDLSKEEFAVYQNQYTELFKIQENYDQIVSRQQILRDAAMEIGDVISNWEGSTEDWIGLLGRALSIFGQLQSAGSGGGQGGGGGGGLFGILGGLLGSFGGGRQRGGPIGPGSWNIVGERGPEIIVPRTPGYVIPNNMIGGSMNITTNINNPVVASSMQADQLQRTIRETVQQAVARSKQDAFLGRVPAPYGRPN